MDESTRTASTALTGNGAERSTDDIRHEIEETREALGDTVAALVEKADVKAHARHKVEEVKHSAAATARGPVGIGVVAFVVAGVVAWIVVRRRK